MEKHQKILLETIDEQIESKLRELGFNRKVEGVVTEVQTPNTYTVKIKDKHETIKTMNDKEYAVGDVVLILILNNNESDKRILTKK